MNLHFKHVSRVSLFEHFFESLFSAFFVAYLMFYAEDKSLHLKLFSRVLPPLTAFSRFSSRSGTLTIGGCEYIYQCKTADVAWGDNEVALNTNNRSAESAVQCFKNIWLKYIITRSLGALRAPTSRLRPFGPAWLRPSHPSGAQAVWPTQGYNDWIVR